MDDREKVLNDKIATMTDLMADVQKVRNEIELTIRKRFGENVKYIRIARGMSQDDLAILLGVNRTTVLQIEQGKPDTTITRLHFLCQVLKCSRADLLD